jgi:hypothetical protein
VTPPGGEGAGDAASGEAEGARGEEASGGGDGGDGSGSGGAPAAWLAGTSRVTLLGDALHPMSPFKGQVCHLTTSSVHEH